MDIIKGRLDRYLSGPTQGKGDPAPESGFGLGGLSKLVLTWEVRYSDKELHFDFSWSVLREKKRQQIYSQSDNYLTTCIIYFYFFSERAVNIKSLLTH